MRICCVTRTVLVGVVALGVAVASGAVARAVVRPQMLDKNAYPIEVAAVSAPAPVSASSSAAAPSVPTPSAVATPVSVPEEQPLPARLAAADPAKGQQIAKVCAACHTFDKGGASRVGPNLWGIVGNKRAHLGDGFAYSTAMKAVGGTWGYKELDAYLLKPRDIVPGTKMAYAGLKKPEDRANLIAYLRSLADKPIPLP